MRRIFPRSPRTLGLALGLAIVAGATALGQPPESGPTSLARYVPKDDVSLYLEFDGVDAHADSWRKTAAQKILNATPAGGMIRDVFTQLFDKAKVPGGGKTFSLLEHVARSGFVVASGGGGEAQKPTYTVVALRDAFSTKETKPLVAQFLASLNAPNTKAQAVIRAGHRVISGKTAGGQTFSWWVEETKKQDVVIVFPSPEATDLILETLDGKQANAADHPLRAGLDKVENGFEPVALGFLNPRAFPALKDPRFGLDEASRIDLRWGFHDDALQTVIRVATPAPRRGMLAFLEGPTFDKASMPPLPDSIAGFTAASLDTRAVFDQVLAAAGSASPGAAARINGALDAFQGKGKLRLRDDILGQLGPKMAFYALPARSSEAGAAPPAALGAMMGMMGVTQVPRGVAIFEVADPVAFGKSLDELMIVVNREIKASFKPPRAPEPPPERDAPPRGRPPAAPFPEFRLSPGTSKTFIFSVPPELSKTFPPSIRPSIRVGAKHVVIAMTSDAAREALEPKGTWAPPPDLASAFGTLPSKLKFLQVGDNRAGIATTLASLPAKVQILANSPLFNPQASPPPATSTPGPMAGSPGPLAGSSNPSGGMRPAGRGAMLPDGPESAGSSRGGSESVPGPGVPPNPADGTKPLAGASSIVIQVAPGKLPSADTVKGMLFPSITLIEVEPTEIRLISREAFPDISGLSLAPTASMLATPGRGMGAAPGIAPIPGGPTSLSRPDGTSR